MNHRIFAYDIWGNDDDGYTVNDRRDLPGVSEAPMTERKHHKTTLTKTRKEKITSYDLMIVKNTRDMIVCEGTGKVCTPADVLPVLEPIRGAEQEHFVVITLNGAGEVINTRVITIGLLNHSLVHPRETFRGAILDNAASVIIAHNHPSGSLDPSPQDLAITEQLKTAGSYIGIQVLDHIIVTKTGYTSLRERGNL